MEEKETSENRADDVIQVFDSSTDDGTDRENETRVG